VIWCLGFYKYNNGIGAIATLIPLSRSVVERLILFHDKAGQKLPITGNLSH
jgi:hypothetical protein